MSDAYYQERARQRTRRLLMGGGLLALVACAVAGVASLFYDACTGGFDRAPDSIVRRYLDAVRGGDARVAQECWEHDSYYELETGCSEVCLARVLGAPFEVQDVSVGPAQPTQEGRSQRVVTVNVSCTGSGETHSGEILLDSVGRDVPWRHWSIVSSTVGGSVAQPWCR
ncbi:MAG TPA: hypothetical protein VLC52_09110 [Anaerolineae bacterium]|nr:hypothetical protein [Anaerolineae bacterium]